VQFTYEIYPETEEVLWKNLRSKKQRIRSAERAVTVSDIDDPLKFWRFYDANWQKKESPMHAISRCAAASSRVALAAIAGAFMALSIRTIG